MFVLKMIFRIFGYRLFKNYLKQWRVVRVKWSDDGVTRAFRAFTRRGRK